MSRLAQGESRSISENVTWGQRKRFAGGKVGFAYNRFLGLDNARIAQDQEEYQKRYDGMVGTIAQGFGSALFFISLSRNGKDYGRI